MVCQTGNYLKTQNFFLFATKIHCQTTKNDHCKICSKSMKNDHKKQHKNSTITINHQNKSHIVTNFTVII